MEGGHGSGTAKRGVMGERGGAIQPGVAKKNTKKGAVSRTDRRLPGTGGELQEKEEVRSPLWGVGRLGKKGAETWPNSGGNS